FGPLPQRDLWRVNEQEKAPMRLNYAPIASETKRRDGSLKTLRKGDRSMDARKHHSAIGYLSIWSREDWCKDVPRTRCADGGVLNMHVAIFVTVVAIVVSFAPPTCASDRPSDPFGNQTIELNKETPLVEMWESLRDQVLLDKAHFHSCIDNNVSNNTDCAAV